MKPFSEYLFFPMALSIFITVPLTWINKTPTILDFVLYAAGIFFIFFNVFSLESKTIFTPGNPGEDIPEA